MPRKWQKYLTVREAAELLGEGSDRAAYKRVLRLIRDLEESNSTTIFVDIGTGSRSALRVTEQILRRWFPERFPARDHQAEIIEEKIAERERKGDAALILYKSNAVRIRALERRMSSLERAVR